MSINAEEFKSIVGLDEVHVALVTQDDADEYVADTPEDFAPAMEASAEPTTSQETQYADDSPFDVMTAEAETKITLSTTNIPVSVLAKYLGKVFDVASGRMFDTGSGATPPDAALSFRSQKSNGKYRYYQYLKGKFGVPKDEAATVKDKKEAKPSQIIFTAVNTLHKFDVGSGVLKSVKRIMGDEDTLNFDGSHWFDQVQTPVVSTPAVLSLSSSIPVDDALDVSKANDLTLTYNNALIDDVVNHITLLDDNSAPVATAITLSDTKKVITINPDDSLEGSTAHTLIATVVDIYGQKLTSIITFTTAA